MTQYLSTEDILLVHHQLIERYGGTHGVRDIERVQSVCEAVKMEAFGQEQYPTVFLKAAVYMRNIIADHAFIDGNKRTGITAAIIFLQNNGLTLKFQVSELENFAVKVATDKLDIPTISKWLATHAS